MLPKPLLVGSLLSLFLVGFERDAGETNSQTSYMCYEFQFWFINETIQHTILTLSLFVLRINDVSQEENHRKQDNIDLNARQR